VGNKPVDVEVGAEDGRKKMMKPYTEAVWSWFRKNAGVPEWYGGVDQEKAAQFWAHLDECGRGRWWPEEPDFGSTEHFAGTFEDGAQRVPAVTADVSCKCGMYSGTPLAVEGSFSIGDLITAVLAEGASDEATG
jgi:hypothetical protein